MFLAGGLAQLGEHLPYKQGVAGSSPASSTINRISLYYFVTNNLQIWSRNKNFIYFYIAGWSMFLHARSGNTTRPSTDNLQIWGRNKNFIYFYIAGWSMFLHARSGNTRRPSTDILQIWGRNKNFIYFYIAGLSSLAARLVFSSTIERSALASD